MSKKYILIFSVALLAAPFTLKGQTLLDELNQVQESKVVYTKATFKTTMLALGQSVQTRNQGVFEVSANSRFWNIPERTQGFIADRMTTRFGLAYAFSDRFTFGIGGTTFDGIFDGHLKYKLIRQVNSGKGAPFTLTLFQNASIRTNPKRSINDNNSAKEQLSYTSQLLLARKFTRNFSLQIAPTFVHRGSSKFAVDPENHFALGIGGRYRIGGHVSISSEYYYLSDPLRSITTYDSFAIGVNWELTDLMLQFHLTNTPFIAEDAFITQTRNNFNTRDGNLFFGFNATFIIHFKKQQLED